MRKAILALTTALALTGASTVAAAANITYTGQDNVGGWAISYSITTDGTLGPLAYNASYQLANIVSDSITFVGSAASNPANITLTGTNSLYFSNFLADPNNPGYPGAAGPSPVTATATTLSFDFGGSGGLYMCDGQGEGVCYAYAGAQSVAVNNGEQNNVVYHWSYPNGVYQVVGVPDREVDNLNTAYNLLPGTYVSTTATNQVFATATASAVPEPATWVMLIVGVGLVGGALRRRARTVLATA